MTTNDVFAAVDDEEPLPLYDEAPWPIELWRAWSNSSSNLSVSDEDDVLDEESLLVDVPLPVELPLLSADDPGPPENALAKTFFNSLAWSDVSFPPETSF
ncbi:hypothetical protein UP10_27420 [Bradyrhizobium sp. LTSPM299]|uniref:hypothetical protein n=1 Tax=Bradyrhizobium sp. LTSPM299 TaxID=1619233 RepID=UPI0005CAD5B3|nr:hypothetical protein UP10_27420 [Bradyrhizobium sp. LTSPM299]